MPGRTRLHSCDRVFPVIAGDHADRGNAVTDWNFADVFEAIAATVPDAPAQTCGDRRFAWSEFDARSNALAADLLAAGLGEQAKVAAYLYNGPEYLESYFAAFKAGLVPVNTNFRYGPEEIRYLFDNADAEAVVFHTSFTPLLEQVRDRLPGVKVWYGVNDGSPIPAWARNYDDVVAVAPETGGATGVRGPWGRGGDQLLFLYTGGTTGMPKGVMWRQDDLFNVLGAGGSALMGVPPATNIAELTSRLGAGPGPVMLPACPLMHGTGQFSALIALVLGGCVVTLSSRQFRPSELFNSVDREGVNSMVIVGDAFAKPMLAELDANPGVWTLATLRMISSSGVMWSQETKDAMLAHMPDTALVDSYGSSEAVGMGTSVSTKGNAAGTASFMLGPTVHVVADNGQLVEPGSPETGVVAISGYLPVGYYKDPEKSARTFRVIDGVRYSVPGDYANVLADGTLRLLGRGSGCINTGGEKVFPEEIEEVLKQHASVVDAVCVGVPDERFGEVICALVESRDDSVDSDALIEHVRGALARYKAPRHVLQVSTIGRSPAGKVDYKRMRELAVERLV